MQLKIDLKGGVQLQKALKDLERDIEKKEEVALNKCAMFLVNAIKARTAKGVGVNVSGRTYTFEGYTDKYLNFLQSKRNKEGASSKVNLFYSGLMLSNLQPKKVNKFTRRVHFPNQRENLKAFYHDEVGVGKRQTKSTFMNVSKQEENKIQKIFQQEINKIRLR